jgi:predicted transposase YdaD
VTYADLLDLASTYKLSVEQAQGLTWYGLRAMRDREARAAAEMAEAEQRGYDRGLAEGRQTRLREEWQ